MRWLIRALMLALLAPGAAYARPDQFQILVDTNQITPAEAAQAARFAADGVWSIPVNSPPGVDWPRLLAALNAGRWSVSEDNPTASSQIDRVSATMHRMVDAALFYNETPMRTQLPPSEIAAYARHMVPGFGVVGRRVIVLQRSFGDNDPRRAQLQAAMQDPNVAGAAFEFDPGRLIPAWKLPEGCAFVLSQQRRCYVLMPSGHATDYLAEVQRAVRYFAAVSRDLQSPDVYLVLAAYDRPNAVHFLSSGPDDHNSIEAAVAWLKAYRANPSG